MSSATIVRVRRLPAGDFVSAAQLGRHGRYLELDLSGAEIECKIGDMLEMECGDLICLGEVQERAEPATIVAIEHSLDRARLRSLAEAWG